MKLNQHVLHIKTNRLLLVPMTYHFVSKILSNDMTVYEEFGIIPANEWPSRDTMDIMPIIKDKLSSLPSPDGFGAWLFVDKVDNSIVGDGGFKGSPDDDGEIDLGYGIIESRRRQGYAFEAVSALIKWGLSQSNVNTITADCLISNIASRSLLKKLGMAEVRQDDELIYFQLDKRV